MITMYGSVAGGLRRLEVSPGSPPRREDVTWIDLFDPSREEELAVEKMLGLQVPTRAEMAEIEESARLYRENDATVMTAVIINGAAEDRPSPTPLTFVLTPTHLITVRYADPAPFRLFAAKCQRQPDVLTSAATTFVALVETIVERAADVLESVATDLNTVSAKLFYEDTPRIKPAAADVALQALIRRLGRRNMTIAVLRESLVGLARLAPFARIATGLLDGDLQARVKQVERDLRSLVEYESHLSSEIVYLHDATLGLINLEQNRIIKVFSIAAVLFLPPTVVGTIYGMNFVHMPELQWAFGYPMALGLMVISALVPYFWFRFKGWL